MTDENKETSMTLPEARHSRMAELEKLRPQITMVRGEEVQLEDALTVLSQKRAELEAGANRIAGEIGIIDMLMTQPQPEPDSDSE